MLIDWDKLIEYSNPFWIDIYSLQLKCLSKIIYVVQSKIKLEQDNQVIRELIDKIILSNKNNDSYTSLCAKLWYKITLYDSGCGSTNEICYKFIGEIVDKIIKQYNEYQQKIKLEQIIQLEKEIGELKSSLINPTSLIDT